MEKGNFHFQTFMTAKSVTSWYLKRACRSSGQDMWKNSHMGLVIAVNVLIYDIKGAGRKGIALRLYNVAVVKGHLW